MMEMTSEVTQLDRAGQNSLTLRDGLPRGVMK